MKRFLDTGFLNQKWIRKLKPEQKIFLIYLMLECDNAGIIDLDMEDAEFWIGKKFGNPVDFLPEGYLIPVSNGKYFQPKFIEWQYPNFPVSKVHQQKQAKEILAKHCLFDIENQIITLPNTYPTLTQSLPDSQVIGNVDVNVDDNGNVIKDVNNNIPFDDFWNLYNKKVGDKKKCEKKWKALKDDQREIIMQTLPKWLKQFSDKQFQPYPETYLNQERWNDEIKVTKLDSSFD